MPCRSSSRRSRACFRESRQAASQALVTATPSSAWPPRSCLLLFSPSALSSNARSSVAACAAPGGPAGATPEATGMAPPEPRVPAAFLALEARRAWCARARIFSWCCSLACWHWRCFSSMMLAMKACCSLFSAVALSSSSTSKMRRSTAWMPSMAAAWETCWPGGPTPALAAGLPMGLAAQSGLCAGLAPAGAGRRGAPGRRP
mmetsp:Transcript_90719/g.236282  ORF Transcript_90719/g.236282 Transcript_90719/m.236282 type:complete len:203 (+) Transcript_90719:240-848(+)